MIFIEFRLVQTQQSINSPVVHTESVRVTRTVSAALVVTPQSLADSNSPDANQSKPNATPTDTQI